MAGLTRSAASRRATAMADYLAMSKPPSPSRSASRLPLSRLSSVSVSVADFLLMLVDRSTPHCSVSRIEHRYTICDRQSPRAPPSCRRWVSNDVHVALSNYLQWLLYAVGRNGR